MAAVLTLHSSSSDAVQKHIGGIGTVSGRAPLAPGGLPGFTGPFPSTSLDKGAMRLSGTAGC
jgi:hypothetical protein